MNRPPSPSNKGMHRSARSESRMNPGVRLARPVKSGVRRGDGACYNLDEDYKK
jgi:hypothetical protein